MCPDESPISGLDGLTGEVYRDIKAAATWFVNRVARPFKHHRDSREALAAFNPDFPNHGIAVTSLVNYAEWHESDQDWRDGNGLLSSATFGELPHLWTRVERFARYEARLLRFIRSGGEVRRVFVIDDDLSDSVKRFPLYSTLSRHKALRFKPHILGINDLLDAAKAVDVRSDVLASFNGRIAYFFQCHDDSNPTMVRTLEPAIVRKVENVVAQLWKRSSTVEAFFRRHHIEVPDQLKEQIGRDIETVEELAYQARDTPA
jgi:hypothetical protein